MKLQARVHRGDDAHRLLDDPAFLAEWRSLAAADPKHTWFQEPTFAGAWYAAYASRHEAFLVTGWQDGALAGLMPLALTGDGLVHAGAHQCEYQGWIAAPEIDATFGRLAVEAAMKTWRGRWEWRNTAPGIPSDWIEDPGARGTLATAFESPLLDVADSEFIDARMKGRLRSYRNRLERRGMRYARFTDAASAREFLPRLERWCDLRQAAAHGSVPFALDSAKADFHARLLACPEEVWLSVLWLEELPVAAHLGPFAHGELAMGVQGYDPREGKLSPGTILMFEMAADISSAGGRLLDLTPGGDAWKERYASRHRTLHHVVLHGSRAAAIAEQARRRAVAGARAAVRTVAGEPDALRQRVAARPAEPAIATHEISRTDLPAPYDRGITTTDIDRIQTLLIDHAVRRGPEATRDMLSLALRRMSQGWMPVATLEGETLRALLWLNPAGSEVDLTDPGDPRLRGDGTGDVPDGTRLVIADSAGGVAPDADPGEILAAAVSLNDRLPDRLLVITDAGSQAMRRWLDAPCTDHHLAAQGA